MIQLIAALRKFTKATKTNNTFLLQTLLMLWTLKVLLL